MNANLQEVTSTTDVFLARISALRQAALTSDYPLVNVDPDDLFNPVAIEIRGRCTGEADAPGAGGGD